MVTPETVHGNAHQAHPRPAYAPDQNSLKRIQLPPDLLNGLLTHTHLPIGNPTIEPL